MKKVLLSLFVVTIFISSCKKDKTDAPTPVVYAEENFFDEYLSKTGFNQKIQSITGGTAYYNFGFEFVPLVKGKINSLVVNLPGVVEGLKITLWDKATFNAIKTEVVNIPISSNSYVIDIADIELSKDKEYAISMRTKEYFSNKRTDNSSVNYPVTVGNIKILAFKAASNITSSITLYPNEPFFTICSGNLSFNFQRTE
jgi:hypothetical protein